MLAFLPLLSKVEHAVAGGLAYTGFPAIAGVFAMASLLILSIETGQF
jgi:hypothetical protein